MTDLKIVQRQYAMNLGTCMGIFWAVKFALIPLGLQYSFLWFAYIILTLAVPFIGYRYVAAFRDKVCGGVIGFSQACIFTISMYLFASLLVSVVHYVYFAFIDNGLIAEGINAVISAALQINPVSAADRATFDAAMSMLSAMTAADFTLQYLSEDIFICGLLSIPTALLAMRKRRRGAADETTIEAGGESESVCKENEQ